MCAQFDEFVRHAATSLFPFAVFLGAVMYLTDTITDTEKSQQDSEKITLINAGKKSRFKGLWITLAGGITGAVVTYFKPVELGH